MKYNEFAMEQCAKRLRERALASNTPKRFAGVMFEASEIIEQLLRERQRIQGEDGNS